MAPPITIILKVSYTTKLIDGNEQSLSSYYYTYHINDYITYAFFEVLYCRTHHNNGIKHVKQKSNILEFHH